LYSSCDIMGYSSRKRCKNSHFCILYFRGHWGHNVLGGYGHHLDTPLVSCRHSLLSSRCATRTTQASSSRPLRLITGRICRRQLCRYCFTHGPIFGFFAPQGRHVEPIQVKFGREERTAKFDLDRSRGGGLRPQKLKKLEFYQYNCP